MEDKPNYYAIIPANVRYDSNLKDKAKLLYGEITALSNKNGICFASNSYFAKLYNVTNTTISLLIKDLIDNGYIEREIIYKDGTKEIENRYLRILKEGYLRNLKGGIQENLKDNNTSINNTSNKKEIYKEKRFKKPTLEEVKEYCLERNNNVDAQRFIDFYESKDWMIGKNKMKDWKAAIRTWEKNSKADTPGWFNKENKTKEMTEEEKREMDAILNEIL